MDNMDLKQKLPAGLNEFRLLYRQTLDHRESFWAAQARRLSWHTDFSFVVKENFSKAKISWFGEGRINAAENALHRIIEKGGGDTLALTYYQNGQGPKTYTFSQLKDAVLTLASALDRDGITQGDCIAVNLPNCPEFIICALACAYLGITYLPIGGHLPATLVADDVKSAHAKLLIMSHCNACEDDRPKSETVHSLIGSAGLITVGDKVKDCPTLAEYMADNDVPPPAPAYSMSDYPLFAIYENRVGGKPMGMVFGTGGFLVQSHTSFDAIFNKALAQGKPAQIFNTLDTAKAAFQAYGLWGPLTCGTGIVIAPPGSGAKTLATILTDHDQPAMICQPDLLSGIKTELEITPLETDGLFSVIACCGDALPPRLVKFADKVLVPSPERVVNLWIQNKCGTALINTYPLPELNRAGSLGFGALGIEPLILNDFGQPCKTNVSGNLVFGTSWPAMGRPTYGAEKQFIKTCFSKFTTYFQTFDGVRFDKDGFYWFMGRLDDVIKIKGQGLGTSLIESMLISHPMVAEAAIISSPSESGPSLMAFLVLGAPVTDEEKFIRDINTYIAEKIGPFAVPERVVIARQLPRTATGKLVRRMLRRIASGDAGAIEDTSHLVNAEAIQDLIVKK